MKTELGCRVGRLPGRLLLLQVDLRLRPAGPPGLFNGTSEQRAMWRHSHRRKMLMERGQERVAQGVRLPAGRRGAARAQRRPLGRVAARRRRAAYREKVRELRTGLDSTGSPPARRRASRTQQTPGCRIDARASRGRSSAHDNRSSSSRATTGTGRPRRPPASGPGARGEDRPERMIDRYWELTSSEYGPLGATPTDRIRVLRHLIAEATASPPSHWIRSAPRSTPSPRSWAPQATGRPAQTARIAALMDTHAGAQPDIVPDRGRHPARWASAPVVAAASSASTLPDARPGLSWQRARTSSSPPSRYSSSST